MTKFRLSGLTGLLMFSLAASAPVFAQAVDSSKGAIVVEVQDSTGAVVPGAAVTLKGPAVDKKATSDGRGLASFFTLDPGTYEVSVEMQGFRVSKVGNININANQRTPVQIQLQPGAVSESVQVTDTSVAVDTSSGGVGTTVTSDQFNNIPVARNVASLFSLAPGAVPGIGTDNLNSPKESFNPSISGASGLENQYIIDGINTTDQGYGAFGVWSNNYHSMGSGVNFDFIKEVQIKTGGFEAQYGSALGGVINIVTQSGGNKIHGAAYVYSGPGWAEGGYNDPNVKAGRVSSPVTVLAGRHSTDFGVNIGGPLIKDRLFWYGGINPSYSYLNRLAPIGFGVRALGPQEWESKNYNWVGKLNFKISDNHQIEATSFGDPSRDPSGSHLSLLRDDLDNKSSAIYGTRNWAVKYSGVLGTSTLVSANFAWNHSYFTETPTNPALYQVRDYSLVKPGISAYTLTGGLGYIGNNDSNDKQYNVLLTKNISLLGSHQIDLGYSFNQIHYSATVEYSGTPFALPAYTGIAAGDVGKLQYGGFFYKYPTRAVAGVTYSNVYRSIRGNFSAPDIFTDSGYQDGYLQDAYEVNRYLTIKAGVRWEQQHLSGATSAYTMGGNWAPRIGFIVDPTGHRHTKIFANWGRFYEKLPQDLAVRALTSEQSYLNIYSLGVPPTASNLIKGGVASNSGADPTIVYGGTKAQYSEQLVAGVEHELNMGVVLSARFIHTDLKRIVEDTSGITVEQYNAGSGQQYVIQNPNSHSDTFHNAVTCTSGPNCDPDVGFTLDSGALGPDGRVDGFPDPRRVYNAMQLTGEKRFGKNWSLLANYSLAKLFGNFEGNFRNDNGQSDPNISSLFDFVYSAALADQFKIGPLPTDRRQVINLNGNYVFMGRLNLGMGFQSLSGLPVSELDVHPAYGNAGEIPIGGRGAFGRTPWQNYVNLHTDYRIPLKTENFRIKVAADMFNLFDRQTTTAVDQFIALSGATELTCETNINATACNKDFLKATDYKRPFYARFSLRFEF